MFKICLNKMSLSIKQSFKFLYTFRFSLQYKAVFFARKTYQISRLIIIFYTIKMVNNPAIRKRFTVCLLPYKNMLPDITIPVGLRMFRLIYKNISRTIYTTTFPIRVFTSSFMLNNPLSGFMQIYVRTFTTTCSLPCNWGTTIYTYSNNSSCIMCTFHTTLRPTLYRFPTIWAWMHISNIKFYLCFTSHITIIALIHITSNLIEWVQEIVEAADKAGIPVFLKDNLRPLFRLDGHSAAISSNMNIWGKTTGSIRQEMPNNVDNP